MKIQIWIEILIVDYIPTQVLNATINLKNDEIVVFARLIGYVKHDTAEPKTKPVWNSSCQKLVKVKNPAQSSQTTNASDKTLQIRNI